MKTQVRLVSTLGGCFIRTSEFTSIIFGARWEAKALGSGPWTTKDSVKTSMSNLLQTTWICLKEISVVPGSLNLLVRYGLIDTDWLHPHKVEM